MGPGRTLDCVLSIEKEWKTLGRRVTESDLYSEKLSMCGFRENTAWQALAGLRRPSMEPFQDSKAATISDIVWKTKGKERMCWY
jgi:hypothetical protein